MAENSNTIISDTRPGLGVASAILDSYASTYKKTAHASPIPQGVLWQGLCVFLARDRNAKALICHGLCTCDKALRAWKAAIYREQRVVLSSHSLRDIPTCYSPILEDDL